MARCDRCTRLIRGAGVESEGQLYCSVGCSLRRQKAPFCSKCEATTFNRPTGNLTRIQGIGVTFFRVLGQRPCSTCNSQLIRVWFTFFWIPLIPLARYRIIWSQKPSFTQDGTYYSRRLR